MPTNGVLQDATVRVRVETVPGENVFICGNSPELGEWQVSKASMLSKVSADGNIWGGVIHVPTDQVVQYRYLVCIIVENDGSHEYIVRHWESHLKPRLLHCTNFPDGNCELDIFGFKDDTESIASGWLTSETIVQLKLFNSAVAIWKRRLRNKCLSIHVSAIDITRKDSDVLGNEDDSTCPEGLIKSWPVIEVAQMNDTGWKFSQQSQFGITYNPSDYVLFQAQMLKPDTIAFIYKVSAGT